MSEKKDKKWVQKADVKKGALKEVAKKHHGVDKEGDIKKSFIESAANYDYGATNAKRANLAKTFSKMRNKK